MGKGKDLHAIDIFISMICLKHFISKELDKKLQGQLQGLYILKELWYKAAPFFSKQKLPHCYHQSCTISLMYQKVVLNSFNRT